MADTVLMIEREEEESCIKIFKNRVFGIVGKLKTQYSESNKRIVDDQNFGEESKKSFFLEEEVKFNNNIDLEEEAFFKLMEQY